MRAATAETAPEGLLASCAATRRLRLINGAGRVVTARLITHSDRSNLVHLRFIVYYLSSSPSGGLALESPFVVVVQQTDISKVLKETSRPRAATLCCELCS